MLELCSESFGDGITEVGRSTNQLKLIQPRSLKLGRWFIQMLYWVHMFMLDLELLLDLPLQSVQRQKLGIFYGLQLPLSLSLLFSIMIAFSPGIMLH